MVTDRNGMRHEPRGIPTGGQYAGGDSGHGVVDDLPALPPADMPREADWPRKILGMDYTEDDLKAALDEHAELMAEGENVDEITHIRFAGLERIQLFYRGDVEGEEHGEYVTKSQLKDVISRRREQGFDLIPDRWTPKDYQEAEKHLEAVRDQLTAMSENNRRTRAIAPYEQCVQVNEYGDYITMEQFEKAFPTDLAKARYKAWENQYEYSHWFEGMYMDSIDDPVRLDQLEKSSELWDSDSNEGCYETECTWGDDGDYWMEDRGGENPRTALFEKGSESDVEAEYPGSREIRIQGENIIGRAIKNRPDLVGFKDKRYEGNRMGWRSDKYVTSRVVLLEYDRKHGSFVVTTRDATLPGVDPTGKIRVHRAGDHDGDLKQALKAASEDMVGRLTADVW